MFFFTSTMLSFFLLEYDPYTDPVFITSLTIDIFTLIMFTILSILIFVYWKIYLNSIKQNYYGFNEYWYSSFLRWTKYNNLKIWLIFTFISFGVFCIYLVISVVYNFVNLDIETETNLWVANLVLWILLFLSFTPTLAINFFNIFWFKIKLFDANYWNNNFNKQNNENLIEYQLGIVIYDEYNYDKQIIGANFYSILLSSFMLTCIAFIIASPCTLGLYITILHIRQKRINSMLNLFNKYDLKEYSSLLLTDKNYYKVIKKFEKEISNARIKCLQNN